MTKLTTETARQALAAVVENGLALIGEARAKTADLKQGRLQSEVSGRVIAATKIDLEYRLNAGKLIDIEAKLIASQPGPSGPSLTGPSNSVNAS